MEHRPGLTRQDNDQTETPRKPHGDHEGRRHGDPGPASRPLPQPPGVPVVCPGERINRAVMEYLHSGVEHGMYVPDPSDPQIRTLRVAAR
ncbi:hypothetical protein [Streptomyces sp. NPDC012510]|uniref:Orn/Lys/Arg family decarboxylase n=1 Tax=Streptomyces sp. NPDC012510 TaxID=3364838 RepID=UPI0036E5618E